LFCAMNIFKFSVQR